MTTTEPWRGRCLGVELRWWQLPAEIDAAELDLLSSDERERAAGFKAQRRRVEYVASRARLRGALGEVLGVTPSSIPISPDDSGKPQHSGVLEFNLSHSAQAVLIGWGPRALGVDLEAAGRRTQHISRLRIVAEVQKTTSVGLISAFTLVEAATKATGRGLAAVRGLRLDRVVGAGEVVFLSETQRIRASVVAVPEGYVGAVAVLD